MGTRTAIRRMIRRLGCRTTGSVAVCDGVSYQAPLSLTLRLALPVMAGEGPPSTTVPIAARKAVDADLRRHDDNVAAGGSLSGAVGITLNVALRPNLIR